MATLLVITVLLPFSGAWFWSLMPKLEYPAARLIALGGHARDPGASSLILLLGFRLRA